MAKQPEKPEAVSVEDRLARVEPDVQTLRERVDRMSVKPDVREGDGRERRSVKFDPGDPFDAVDASRP